MLAREVELVVEFMYRSDRWSSVKQERIKQKAGWNIWGYERCRVRGEGGNRQDNLEERKPKLFWQNIGPFALSIMRHIADIFVCIFSASIFLHSGHSLLDNLVSELLDTARKTLPDSNNNQNLCDDFVKFISDQITLIRENIQQRVQDVDSSVCEESAHSTVQYTLDELAPTIEAELIRILTNSSDKTCCIDAIKELFDAMPTNLIKKSVSLIPCLVAIVNDSFKEGLFRSAMRTPVVRPLLKKDNLDRNTMNNYRPISNIPFISKLLEKVAVSRVVEHLSKNNLMEKYESDHNTETALLKVHHDISSALDESHAVTHVILDLSAAYHLWYHWPKSATVSAKCRVWCARQGAVLARDIPRSTDDVISEPIPLTCGVPEGSVLA